MNIKTRLDYFFVEKKIINLSSMCMIDLDTRYGVYCGVVYWVKWKFCYTFTHIHFNNGNLDFVCLFIFKINSKFVLVQLVSENVTVYSISVGCGNGRCGWLKCAAGHFRNTQCLHGAQFAFALIQIQQIDFMLTVCVWFDRKKIDRFHCSFQRELGKYRHFKKCGGWFSFSEKIFDWLNLDRISSRANVWYRNHVSTNLLESVTN